MISRRSFNAAALGALLAGTLHAQDANTPDANTQDTNSQDTNKKGRELIDRVIAALGGQRFTQMQNRVSSGRIYAFFHDQLSGLDLAKVYVDYLEKPPENGVAIRERELLGKKKDYSFLFLADQGWDITFRGARQIPDEDWQRYLRTTRNDILYLLRYRLNEPGMQFEYIGSDVYISKHVEIVDVTDAANQTVRVYLDHNTLFPIHQSFSWLDEQTKMHNDEVTEFDKYRDAGGVMWPFSIERSRNGYKVYQLFADKVDVNQPIPPKTFDLPQDVKVLKKSK